MKKMKVLTVWYGSCFEWHLIEIYNYSFKKIIVQKPIKELVKDPLSSFLHK